MRHHHYPTLALALCLASCSQPSVTDDVTDDGTESSKLITLHCTSDDIEVLTRASLTDASLTDLWIWEDNTLLANQTSADTDFGSPKVALTYGQHHVTFVASKSELQAWDAGVWSTTKEWDTYAIVKDITVDGSTPASLSVELPRRSSRIKFQTTDLVPDDIKTMHLAIANHKSLDSDLKGGTAYTHEATVDISAKVGSTYSVFVNTLTESATDEEDTAVMIEFKDKNGTVLYHYERTVKLCPNRIVTLKGNYFTGSGNSITLSDDDWDKVDQPLFPSE